MKYLIQSSESSVWLDAEYVQGKFWIHFNGKTFCFEEEKQKSGRGKKSESAHASDLVAPMPGKVTKILASINEQIKKGDPVLVMEAMKMEYTLKAGAPGEIVKVNCQVGDQVFIGQILVELRPLDASSGGEPRG